jgi:hypothetical protein
MPHCSAPYPPATTSQVTGAECGLQPAPDRSSSFDTTKVTPLWRRPGLVSGGRGPAGELSFDLFLSDSTGAVELWVPPSHYYRRWVVPSAFSKRD